MRIVKVLTTNDEIISLRLTDREYEELQLELTEQKGYIQEYITTKGKVITDLDIQKIVEDEKSKEENNN